MSCKNKKSDNQEGAVTYERIPEGTGTGQGEHRGIGRGIAHGADPALVMDGLALGKMTIVAAMGIGSEGRKRILGLIEGGSENNEAVKALLVDLIERGLSPIEPRLFVLDGGKALHKAVADVFGNSAVIQRCQVHKKCNVLAHLQESEKTKVSIALTMAYREFDYAKAKF